jgi:hypothetical protein
MRLWLLFFWAFGGCTSSLAQVSQTFGNSSPILNISGAGARVQISAPVQISSTTNIFAAIKALDSADDKDLKRVQELLEKGRYVEARTALENYSAKQRKSFQNIAIAKFSEAQILIADEEVSKAAEALTVALSLDPGNCQYRAMTGFFYEATGRLIDAREVLYANPWANECVLSGDAQEASLLHLARVRLAAELRNEADAVREMQFAHVSMASLRVAKRRGDIGVKCLFRELARAYWNRDAEKRWPTVESACKQELVSQSRDHSGTAVDIFEFYRKHGTDQEGLAAGEAIFKKYRSFDDQNIVGVDRLRRRILFAEIKSDYGYAILWRGGDPAAAARLYAEAFELMVPLLPSARPSIFTNFAQLAIRIKHLEEISTARVFEDSTKRLKPALERASEMLSPRGSVDSCEAMARIRGAAWQMLSESRLQVLGERQYACLAAVAPQGTFTDLRVRYSWSGSDGMPTLEMLNARIALGEQLAGFPTLDGLHGKQAFDRAIRAQLLPHGRKIDEESISAVGRELMQAFAEALLDAEAYDARLVLSNYLLFQKDDGAATQASEVLLSEPKRMESDASPYGRCQAQALRLEELSNVGVFSGVRKNTAVRDRALVLLKAVSASGNLCKAVPRERSMGVVDFSSLIDKVLHQLDLISQIDAMRTNSKTEAEITSAPLTQQCFDSEGRMGLPLCMFFLPKDAKSIRSRSS